jgi:hypothetical protein
MSDVFQFILHIIFEYWLSFFNQINVSCIKADHVHELNEKPAAIKILHIENAINQSQKIKNIVDNKKQIFHIINQFLCPNLSDKYQLGISIKNPAKAPILEKIAISKLFVFHNER